MSSCRSHIEYCDCWISNTDTNCSRFHFTSARRRCVRCMRLHISEFTTNKSYLLTVRRLFSLTYDWASSRCTIRGLFFWSFLSHNFPPQLNAICVRKQRRSLTVTGLKNLPAQTLVTAILHFYFLLNSSLLGKKPSTSHSNGFIPNQTHLISLISFKCEPARSMECARS